MGVTEVESGVLTLPWFEGAVCVEFLSELFGTTAGIDVGEFEFADVPLCCFIATGRSEAQETAYHYKPL